MEGAVFEAPMVDDGEELHQLLHVLLTVDEEPYASARLLKLSPEVVEIRRLAVVEEQRGRGLGKRLLEACLERAKQDGGTTVMVQAPDSAKGFLETFGFQAEGKPSEEEGQRFQWMRKSLVQGPITRRWTLADISGLVDCHRAAYTDLPKRMQDSPRLYEMQYVAFPEGQYLIELDNRIVGYSTSLIVQLEDYETPLKYREITGASTFSTHDPAGDTLYGADIAVHPDYRGRGLSALLYEQRVALLRRYNLRRMLAYGRIPGYASVAGKMTAREYVDKVVAGELRDPALNAHLKAGYTVSKVVLNLASDQSSANYATWLEMENEDFDSDKWRIAAHPLRRPVTTIRVCAAQYYFRPIKSWERFEETVRFYVETADTYHSHFLLLPEYFTAQLFSLMPRDWDEIRTVQELANWAPRIDEMLREMAQEYQMFIIGGSTAIWRDGKLYNVAHLYSPAGNVYTQDKLHITPSEREDWGIHPGEGIKVFETPFGRIAIQICYDVEFPELGRLLTLNGVEVLFVPYSTDEKKGFYRIRYTCQARAVENYVYVVSAGNVGNLPSTNYLLNYGRSAVFTPSDFSFPPAALAGEADPNTETVVVTDLDLTILARQRETGQVRPLYDRRPDLYELRARVPVELVVVE